MQIDQNINSYVLLQLILHYLKEKIAVNRYSNQLLPSNRYLEILIEMAIFLAFQLFLYYLQYSQRNVYILHAYERGISQVT